MAPNKTQNANTNLSDNKISHAKNATNPQQNDATVRRNLTFGISAIYFPNSHKLLPGNDAAQIAGDKPGWRRFDGRTYNLVTKDAKNATRNFLKSRGK